MTSYRVVDRSGGRSLLDRISGKQKQKSVREVAEEVRAAALQVECYFLTTAEYEPLVSLKKLSRRDTCLEENRTSL